MMKCLLSVVRVTIILKKKTLKYNTFLIRRFGPRQTPCDFRSKTSKTPGENQSTARGWILKTYGV